MCARFTLRTDSFGLAHLFGLEGAPNFEPRYNIAPTQFVPMVTAPKGERQWDAATWGLIPTWVNDLKKTSRPVNARAETIAVKPMFRHAFRRRRCLVPADGYFEWQNRGKYKQPFFFHRPHDEPFAFAGIYEDHPEFGRTCALVTSEPNAQVAEYHDRMPVILLEEDFEAWLDPKCEDINLLQAFLTPSAEFMEIYPVNRIVGNPRIDIPECIQRVDDLFSQA
ncbi:MAG: putative SOS response-associated peptidase YedK [Fimbriimonadaceae bacterium]|nr:putative SOS response-associated peptidase YedK [Fimbriimonadaceae bacterium]